jgi:outer membrane biosynthesis protein TonB
MKRAKETTEAKKNETREVRQNEIAEANRIAQEERELKEKRKKDDEEERKRVKEAKKEAKKEERKRVKEAKEVERKRVKDAKEVERAEKEKAALGITKSQGKSTGVNWNRSRCKWVVGFQRRGVIPRHLGCFDDHAEAVATYSSYSSMTKEERKARNNSQ